MQKTRKQQEQAKAKAVRNAPTQGANRSAPQPLDEKLLKQISGGGLTEAPRGGW